MKYADLKLNDCTNGIGVCVSLWMQGCSLRCPGCHNPQTWDPNGGIEIAEDDLIDMVLEALGANGIQRNLSILGGEPLLPQNADFLQLLIYWVKKKYPDTEIFLWSGYTLEQLQERADYENAIGYVLDNIDMLAAGPFKQEERDITLPLVGSRNQKVYWKQVGQWTLYPSNSNS